MSRDFPKCPWCRVEVDSAWAFFNAAEDEVRAPCPYCGELLLLRREIKVKYRATKAEPDEAQDLLDESVPDEKLPGGS